MDRVEISQVGSIEEDTSSGIEIIAEDADADNYDYAPEAELSGPAKVTKLFIPSERYEMLDL